MKLNKWIRYTKQHNDKMHIIENKEGRTGRCLNLGSGNVYLKGFVNVDYNKNRNPDVVWDLNKIPYPFKDNEFDYVYCSHILEHLTNLYSSLKEIIRITKVGGVIHVRVPHFSYG